jgi:hypothetical protein
VKSPIRRIFEKSFVAWYSRSDGPVRRFALRRLMARADVADVLREVAPSYHARNRQDPQHIVHTPSSSSMPSKKT